MSIEYWSSIPCLSIVRHAFTINRLLYHEVLSSQVTVCSTRLRWWSIWHRRLWRRWPRPPCFHSRQLRRILRAPSRISIAGVKARHVCLALYLADGANVRFGCRHRKHRPRAAPRATHQRRVAAVARRRAVVAGGIASLHWQGHCGHWACVGLPPQRTWAQQLGEEPPFLF